MSNNNYSYRPKKRMRIKYKNAAILLAVTLLIITAICASCSALRKKEKENDKGNDSQLSDQGSDVQSNTPDPEENNNPVQNTSDPASQMSYRFDYITMTEADLGKGNLVLVNNNIKFLGSVNEDELDVAIEKSNDAYWVSDYTVKVLPITMNALNSMLLDFYNEKNNSNVMVRSGYRTIEYQQELYDEELKETGAVSSSLVALPGYSEHHTGLAVDFTTYDGSVYKSFENDGDYTWIYENCYKYGFVNRYPSGKEKLTLIDNEPWHFRYVGSLHAKIMKEYDYCLEEYISFIKRYTIDDGFLLADDIDGSKYIVYYQPLTSAEGTAVYIPTTESGEMYPYEISGNNIDGFIISVKIGNAVSSPMPADDIQEDGTQQ